MAFTDILAKVSGFSLDFGKKKGGGGKLKQQLTGQTYGEVVIKRRSTSEYVHKFTQDVFSGSFLAGVPQRMTKKEAVQYYSEKLKKAWKKKEEK